MSVYYAVEDQISGSILSRLIRTFLGAEIEPIELGKSYGGFGYIKKQFGKYVDLSKREPVIVLTDLDQTNCAPELRRRWLDQNHILEPLPAGMAFCIAVREVETWLMADRDNFASFLQVSRDLIEHDVENNVDDPKAYLLRLASRSRNRSLRENILPEPRSNAPVGLGYNLKLSEFARGEWNPNDAAAASESLRRAIQRIQALA